MAHRMIIYNTTFVKLALTNHLLHASQNEEDVCTVIPTHGALCDKKGSATRKAAMKKGDVHCTV
jgi:hypothetical protein